MRIALDATPLIQKNPTGVARVTYNLIDALVKASKKHNLVITGVVPRGKYGELKKLEWFQEEHVEEKFVPVPARAFSILGRWWQKMGFPKLEQFVGDIGVYHSFDWWHLPTRCVSTSYVYDLGFFRDEAWHPEENSDISIYRYAAIAEKCEMVFALSRFTKREFEKSELYRGNRVVIAYPGLDREVKRDTKASSGSDEIKIEGKYILYVGRLEPRKNIARLIEACDRLSKRGGEFTLVLAGPEGWLSEKMYKKIRSREYVKLMGYVSSSVLNKLYRNACGFVMVSLYEGFGLPILEAMNHGCPVVISDSASMPEVGGESAIYADPNKVNSIAKALEVILDMSKLERKKMSKLMMKQAKKFSYEKTAKLMLKEWEGLVDR